jgi:hypothetical protein
MALPCPALCRPAATCRLFVLALSSCVMHCACVRAEIYRWNTGELIAGTEGITPSPRVDLRDWNTELRNLGFGDFSGALSLARVGFKYSWLDGARFTGAILIDAGQPGTGWNVSARPHRPGNAHTQDNVELRI